MPTSHNSNNVACIRVPTWLIVIYFYFCLFNLLRTDIVDCNASSRSFQMSRGWKSVCLCDWGIVFLSMKILLMLICWRKGYSRTMRLGCDVVGCFYDDLCVGYDVILMSSSRAIHHNKFHAGVSRLSPLELSFNSAARWPWVDIDVGFAAVSITFVWYR